MIGVHYIAQVKKGLNKGFLHLKKGEEINLSHDDVKSWKTRGYLAWMSKPDDYEIIDSNYIDVFKVICQYDKVEPKTENE